MPEKKPPRTAQVPTRGLFDYCVCREHMRVISSYAWTLAAVMPMRLLLRQH